MLAPIRRYFRHECKVSVCLLAALIQLVVFQVTPLVNMVYDGWPRGWLVLSCAVLAALFGGLGPGLSALATGVALIWWRGTTFVPTHPGLEVFTALGLTQIVVIYRLQLTQRELLRRQEALEAARNKANYLSEVAQRANRSKDEFLATLSHELRTPLNVILGYGRMLGGDMATPEFIRNASAAIERNAAAQIRIVEDLLDVQRVITAGITIEYSRFDVRALGHSVMESLHPAAAGKRLHWAAHFDAVTVEADRARLQQVLWNLLSNAVKFTPEDGCIHVSAVQENNDLVITVEDSGEGIPPDFLPHVFEPFRQLDMSSTRRHGGLGLGLAIVKNIVEAHRGTVTAESEGSGSLFTVRLPVSPRTEGQEAVA